MSQIDFELGHVDPTNEQKRQFRRAVIANAGRTCLDPCLKVFMDPSGYVARVTNNVTEPDGRHVIEIKEVVLTPEGDISVDYGADDAGKSLFREIANHRAKREREEAIDAYCQETGRSRMAAEAVITDYMATSERFATARELFIKFMENSSAIDFCDPGIDAFEFGELTQRIIRSHIAF